MNTDVLARHKAAMRAIRKVDDQSDRRLLLLYVLFGSGALKLAEAELEHVDQLEDLDHIDHREHGWANLTATCRACNTAKGQLTALRFMLAQSLRNDRNDITAQIRAIGDPHGENRLATHRKRINATS